MLGLLSDVGGYLCQAGALALAAVAFVEPILASGVIMALFLGSALTHRRLRRSDWLWVIAFSGALAAFLYEVTPTGGRSVVPSHRWVLAGPTLCIVFAGCVAWAATVRGPLRAALLGAAAGVSFGVSAVLTKALVHFLDRGVFGWVGHWEPYMLAVTAIGGVVIAQSAFQTGALAASVGATEAIGPLTAAALGFGVLDEGVDAQGIAPYAVIAVSVVVMLLGIAALARAEEYIVETQPANT